MVSKTKILELIEDRIDHYTPYRELLDSKEMKVIRLELSCLYDKIKEM